MGSQDNDNDILSEDEQIRVTLDMDDGTQEECEILTIFELNGQDYIVLFPLDENDEESEEGTVYIYRYLEDEEGNPSLDNIKDEAESKAVEEKFNELLDEADFDES